ncbi:MAG: glycosyltransferase family 4 protein, partial [Verrucomicrobiales bacterium]|nr:glycosyltransferase family 4 protein [Verrucomicrobiales bacterium]
GVFVFTRAEADEMVRLGVERDRVCQIGVGPLLAPSWDAAAFRQRFGIRKNMVLFLGQKLPYKGFDVLLAAAPKVWERHPETSFVFIGPHYNDSERQIKGLADPRIIDIPRVDAMDPLKASALAAADVFALPSRQEGIGGVYIEAWAMRKPVIGCRIPFLTIEEGKDGFLVNQEAGEIAGRITQLLEDPALARRLGEHGRAKVDREYSWETIVDRVEEFYQRTGAR